MQRHMIILTLFSRIWVSFKHWVGIFFRKKHFKLLVFQVYRWCHWIHSLRTVTSGISFIRIETKKFFLIKEFFSWLFRQHLRNVIINFPNVSVAGDCPDFKIDAVYKAGDTISDMFITLLLIIPRNYFTEFSAHPTQYIALFNLYAQSGLEQVSIFVFCLFRSRALTLLKYSGNVS